MDKINLKPIIWKDNRLYLLNQRKLPHDEEYICCESCDQVIDSIKTMVVRGAPAIGIAGAYALAIAAIEASNNGYDKDQMIEHISKASSAILNARPTAVNLGWALDRINKKLAYDINADTGIISETIEKEATSILEEDIKNNLKIGTIGAKLVPMKASILTHCNAGSLATGGYGTALGVIRTAFRDGKDIHVTVSETRPFFQGSRLTAYEMLSESIPATLITDSCAGFLMSRGKIDMVIVGADRIALNGDTANKIGTYALSVLANYHGIPFYIAAPTSTIDIMSATGDLIEIEERAEEEITVFREKSISPQGFSAYNPAFDITPVSLITAIITEKGIIYEPDTDKIMALNDHVKGRKRR